MGIGVSSRNSQKSTTNPQTSNSHETNTDRENCSYYFESGGIKFDNTPIAYRDSKGNIKSYPNGEAPTILVPDEDSNNENNGEDITQKQDHDEEDRKSDRVATPDYENPIPPVIKRRDLIPDDEVFRLIDEHSIRAPPDLKEDVFNLLDYLTEVTCTPLEHVRAFYIWITHNINFDTSGFFGRDTFMPTDPTSVLKHRLTTSCGYTELMEEFCSLANIPVKTIYGFVKQYGYKAETDVMSDKYNAHAWNAVFIENEWRLLDATWGAGYIKIKEKLYITEYNEVYFLTDPSTFVQDHFPYRKDDHYYCDKWQLLEKPLDKKYFNCNLNLDTFGKVCGIGAISHKHTIIPDVQFDVDITLQETFTCLSDYVALLFMDGRKLAQHTYIYKLEHNKVNVHVRVPVIGDILLQLYGRRSTDDKKTDMESLLRYQLKVTTAHENATPYPQHHTVYGPIPNIAKYGLSDVGEFHHGTKTGELTITIKPNKIVDFIPKLYFGDHTVEQNKQYLFVNYSPDLDHINIHTRLPFRGNFKLTLYCNEEDLTEYNCTPVMTYLIENPAKACSDLFPLALGHAVKYKCCLCKPLSKVLPAYSRVLFEIKSTVLSNVKLEEIHIPKIDDITFSAIIQIDGPNSVLKLYGAEEDGAMLHPLYVFNTL